MTSSFKIPPGGDQEPKHQIDAEQGGPADRQQTECDGEASENHKREPRDDFKKDLDPRILSVFADESPHDRLSLRRISPGAALLPENDGAGTEGNQPHAHEVSPHNARCTVPLC